MVSFVRSGRILATSGAKAAWKIRQVQSKKSSRSRFSAASLRGLTGHHTAPAREIPNTQLKATGSFTDKMATLSPGSTPARSNARAIRQDNRRTSPKVSVRPAVVRQGASGPREAPLSRKSIRRTRRPAVLAVQCGASVVHGEVGLHDQPEAAQHAEQLVVAEGLAA